MMQTDLLERVPAAWRRSGNRVIIILPSAPSEIIELEGLAATVWAMLVVPASTAELTDVMQEMGASADLQMVDLAMVSLLDHVLVRHASL